MPRVAGLAGQSRARVNERAFRIPTDFETNNNYTWIDDDFAANHTLLVAASPHTPQPHWPTGEPQAAPTDLCSLPCS